MGSPTVSVVIPVYNAAHCLAAALESVLGQEFSDYEIVVIDGGSTDGTDRVAEKFGSKVQFFSSPDRGVYDAMNKGIARCTGTWIYLMGADDRLADTMVLQKVFSGKYDAVDLICGSVHNEASDHRLVPGVMVSHFGKRLFWKNSVHQQSAFYKRALFSTQKFDASYRILGDYDFHLYLLHLGARAVHIQTVVAVCGALGLSKNFRWNLYAEELRIKCKRLPWWILLPNYPWVVFKYIIKRITSR